jgi:hypothetical protein
VFGGIFSWFWKEFWEDYKNNKIYIQELKNEQNILNKKVDAILNK